MKRELKKKSEVLYKQFLKNKSNVMKMNEENYEIFYEFLKFLYSGNCKITDENVFALLETSSKYKMHSLSKLLIHYISENLKKENLFHAFQIAKKFGKMGKILEKKCWDFFYKNAEEIFSLETIY